MKLLEVLDVHELVVEDDVLVDFVLPGKNFETEPVSFAVLPQFVGMSGAEDQYKQPRGTPPGFAAGHEHILDALVWAKADRR